MGFKFLRVVPDLRNSSGGHAQWEPHFLTHAHERKSGWKRVFGTSLSVIEAVSRMLLEKVEWLSLPWRHDGTWLVAICVEAPVLCRWVPDDALPPCFDGICKKLKNYSRQFGVGGEFNVGGSVAVCRTVTSVDGRVAHWCRSLRGGTEARRVLPRWNVVVLTWRRFTSKTKAIRHDERHIQQNVLAR